jgi:hypothetical protein
VNIDCGNPKNAATLKKYGIRSWPQFNICRVDEETNHSILRIHDGIRTAGIDQGARETTSGETSWGHRSGCGVAQGVGAEQLHLQPAAIVGRDTTGRSLESSG